MEEEVPADDAVGAAELPEEAELDPEEEFGEAVAKMAVEELARFAI